MTIKVTNSITIILLIHHLFEEEEEKKVYLQTLGEPVTCFFLYKNSEKLVHIKFTSIDNIIINE
jgi:hypothetical protein